jgi:hypothetical protein
LKRYEKALDDHGFKFLSYQTGLDATVSGLLDTLEYTAQSWLNAKCKRRVSQLREATGSADTFIFDDCVMCCSQENGIRKMNLYSLECSTRDPMAETPSATLELSEVFNSGRLPSAGVECYDSGQDLLAFVHVREKGLVWSF